jgi:hypothetical protein
LRYSIPPAGVVAYAMMFTRLGSHGSSSN